MSWLQRPRCRAPAQDMKSRAWRKAQGGMADRRGPGHTRNRSRSRRSSATRRWTSSTTNRIPWTPRWRRSYRDADLSSPDPHTYWRTASAGTRMGRQVAGRCHHLRGRVPPRGPAGEKDLPAILSWSYYGKRSNLPGQDNFTLGVPQGTLSNMCMFEGPDPAYWCKQGYAVINVDARGIGNSEGDFVRLGRRTGETATTPSNGSPPRLGARQGGHVRQLGPRHVPVAHRGRAAAASDLYRPLGGRHRPLPGVHAPRRHPRDRLQPLHLGCLPGPRQHRSTTWPWPRSTR